jgi:hypothetical protein
MRGVRFTFVSPVRTTQSFADSMSIVRSYVLDAQRCWTRTHAWNQTQTSYDQDELISLPSAARLEVGQRLFSLAQEEPIGRN